MASTEPIDLNPSLIAFDNELHKGAFVVLPEPSDKSGKGEFKAQVLRFQYNPETITRTRTGEWKSRNKNVQSKAASSAQEERGKSGQGAGALLAKSETISFKLLFDATEALLAGRAGVDTDGILPQLAVLEDVALGKESQEASRGKPPPQVTKPVRPSELLLVLGRQRTFPVVLTSLTITEQKFSPQLVPIRAEVDVKLRVLEPFETAYNTRIQTVFNELLDRRQKAEQRAVTADTWSGGINDAIANALYPPLAGGK